MIFIILNTKEIKYRWSRF